MSSQTGFFSGTQELDAGCLSRDAGCVQVCMRWLTSIARAACSCVAGATYASPPFPLGASSEPPCACMDHSFSWQDRSRQACAVMAACPKLGVGGT